MDFVNFEQAKQQLGKTDDELQAMIKKGELRAFRDGGTWKFRKEDIDAKAPAPAVEPAKEAGDTLMSIDADILFAEEEEVPADSAAETWIAADTEGVFPGGTAAPESPRGVAEAMAAPETEPAPLALSPETDESSLGAVLSEEELGGGEAGGEEPVIAVDAESGLATVVPSGTSATAVAPSRTRIVTLVEPPAHHGQFTFMLGLAAVFLGLAALAVMSLWSSASFMANPGITAGQFEAGKTTNSAAKLLVMIGSDTTPLILIVIAAVIIGLAALVGYILDKQRAAREAIGA